MNLSVIIPVYNAEVFIREAVESILRQNCPELELILINDGSTDDSLEICQSLANQDARIKLIAQQNSGPAKARNEGIKIATGDYITFVDADDFLDLDYFENMLPYLMQNADIVVSEIKIFSDNTETKLRNNIPADKVLGRNEIRNYFVMRYFNGSMNNIPSLCNKFYRTRFLQGHNLRIDETRVRAEDYWFNFEALQKADSVIYTKICGYSYRANTPESVMKSFRENQFSLFLKSREKLQEYAAEEAISYETTEFESRFLASINEYLLMGIRKGKGAEFEDFILKNQEFRQIVINSHAPSLHTRLIKMLFRMNLPLLSKYIYKIWAKR